MAPSPTAPTRIGRYLMAGPIAVGGMASVHFGRLDGPAGFRRTVAIKRMLPALAVDPQARVMLVDEARLAARVRHANVVQTLDVVEAGGELLLVLEYVHGESLHALLARAVEAGARCPVPIALAIVAAALRGLHAAHEVKGDDGQPLELVHRDVSPQNLLVDTDGVTRVSDFGVARARGRVQGTREGQLKGKLAYLAPEQVHGETSRRSDLFSAGIVLWEAVTGARLFDGANEAEVLSRVLSCRVPRLVDFGVALPGLQPLLDRALALSPDERFGTAAELAEALEALGAASPAEVSAWVRGLAGPALEARAAAMAALEQVPEATAQGTPQGLHAPALGQAPSGSSASSRRTVAWVALGVTLVGAAVSVGWWRGRDGSGDTPRSAEGPDVSSARTSVEGAARTAAGGAGGESAAKPLAPSASAGDAAGEGARAPLAPLPAGGEAAAQGAAKPLAPSPAAGDATRAGTAKPSAGTGTVGNPARGGASSGAGRAASPRATPAAQPADSAARPAAAGCNPPYAIDADGTKRFKVECLK